jgi:hypothetical protein
MRALLIAGMLAMSAPAWAQSSNEVPSPCLPSSHIDKVVVTMADGSARRGSLLCLGVDELTLAGADVVERFRLEDVWKIRKAADPLWDGALKGAAIGLLPLVFGCPAECVIRTTAAYGLLGLAIDAVDTNRDTLYRSRGAQKSAIGLRVRF